MNTASAEKNAVQQMPSAERQGLIQWAGQKFGVEAGKVFPILKATCFRADKDGRQATDAEVAVLMIVAREHGLNPFLKEIFAFPDKKGGIVPVVGVDGWIRIINSHSQFNGMDFTYEKADAAPAWVECSIFRKDREHPIKVREFLGECKRDTVPWKSHPSRMLRHKALIQCARVAFGFAGMYDEDEADRIIEGQTAEQAPAVGGVGRGAAGLKAAVLSDGIDVTQQAEHTVAINSTGAAEGGPQKPSTSNKGTLELQEKYLSRIKESKDTEILDILMDEARSAYEWTPADLQTIEAAYKARQKELSGS